MGNAEITFGPQPCATTRVLDGAFAIVTKGDVAVSSDHTSRRLTRGSNRHEVDPAGIRVRIRPDCCPKFEVHKIPAKQMSRTLQNA
jgi:hypothetical protein